MYFLWASEDVRQQKFYAGLLVLDKQKYEADKNTLQAPPNKIFIDDDLKLKARSKRREARAQPLLSRK